MREIRTSGLEEGWRESAVPTLSGCSASGSRKRTLLQGQAFELVTKRRGLLLQRIGSYLSHTLMRTQLPRPRYFQPI